MELKFASMSPYARKVMVVAHEAGVAQRIRVTPVKTREEPHTILPFNPLAKIPALVLDDGTTIYDSPVICEYLDAEFGAHRLLAASGPQRWRTLTRAALADGALDAGLLVRWERLRPPELRRSTGSRCSSARSTPALDRLEDEVETFGPIDLGLVGVGCAVGYLPDSRSGDQGSRTLAAPVRVVRQALRTSFVSRARCPC